MKIHKYVGLDVHKEKTTVAIANGARHGEVRHTAARLRCPRAKLNCEHGILTADDADERRFEGPRLEAVYQGAWEHELAERRLQAWLVRYS